MSRPKPFYDLVMKLWPLGRVVYSLGKHPFFGKPIRMWFNSNSNEAVIIPVNEVVRVSDSIILPYALLTPLVEEASVRFIMAECMCRSNEGCQAYPHQVGCLFIGDGAAQINSALGRVVETGEALAHIQRAMQKGLAPLIVHTTFDSHLLGIPYRRMLTVCFCCDCCCLVRHGLSLGPQAFWDIVIRLPGLQVEVTEECAGCEACLEVCRVRAISIEDGLAVINDDCKGCGRCAAVCPMGAITFRLDENVDVVRSLLGRIRARTDIGKNGKT